MMRRALGFLAVFALTCSTAGIAAAQQGEVTRYLRGRHEAVNRLMRSGASAERRSAAVTEILSDLLDYRELSRRALAQHWEARSPEERERFVSLLKQLVERNYESNLERISDFEVRYTAEQQTEEGVRIETEARSRIERRQPPVEIAYSMHDEDGHWRVFDVITDGVSLVTNYRRQFARIIANDGWDALIERMEERLADETGSASREQSESNRTE